MSRFISFESITIQKNGDTEFFDFMINPFQIESMYQTEVSYDCVESGERITEPCCYIMTKSGARHNVMGTLESVIKRLEC